MKKLLKILAWIAGIFIILLVLVIVGFKLFFPMEKARAYAIEKGSELLGREITIAGIDLSVWGGLGLQLENVAVGNPVDFETGNFLTADNVDLKMDLWPLITGDVRIDKLVINKPVISMHKTTGGAINYAFKTVEKAAPMEVTEQLTPETKTAGFAVSFDRFNINDGQLSFVDDSSDLKMDAIGFNISTSLSGGEPGIYLSSGDLVIDSLLISTDIPLPHLSITLKYDAEYDMTGKHLKLNDAHLSFNELNSTISGEYSFGDDGIKARGNIKSDRVVLSDLFSLLPPEKLQSIDDYSVEGELALDVDVDYDDTREEPFDYAGTATINTMKMSKSDISGVLQFQRALVDFKPDNLRLNIEQGTFDGKPIKGHMVVADFNDPSVNGELAGSLNLAFVKPFLPDDMQAEIGGQASFNIRISGKAKDYQNIDFSGDLTITDGHYNSPELPEPMDSFQLDAYFDRELTNIKNLSASMKSGNINFSGRINDLVPYVMADSINAQNIFPVIDGNFSGKLDLTFLQRYLPPKGNPQLTGEMDVNLTLSGTTEYPERLVSYGEIQVVKATYNDDLLPEPLQSFDATLKINPDTITVEKLDIRFVSSDVSFSGKLADPFPYLLPLENIDRSKMKKPTFLFELSSNHFDVDKLFPEAAPGSGANRATLPADSISNIILPDINGRGTVQADTVVYMQIEFTSITGKVKIYDRKIECYDMTGDVYTGKVTGNTTIDLANFDNPHYTGAFQGIQVEADEFVSRFTKFGGHVYGKVDLNGSYDAYGWEPEAFLNSLSMNSTANMKNGKIVTSGNVYSAISAVAEKTGQTFDKEQPVKNMSTNIKVQDGKVALDELTTRLGTLGDVSLNGFYAFSGELNYNGSILLSKENTEKLLSKGGLLGGLAGLLSDNSIQRIKLPIAVGGTADSPKMNVDYTALAEGAKDNIKDEAGNLLKGLFKKKKD